jgi:LmbE family N-acetylglucosaminyl deacetylase
MSAPSGLPVGDLPSAGPATRDLAVPATALAIGAHPDDIEFGCGATLAKWAAAGCRLHHLILTDGSKGSWDPGADVDRLAAERMDECRSAARVLDGSVNAPPSDAAPPDTGRLFFLGRRDGELVNGVDERREVVRILRLVRPAVVLGHDPWRRYRLHPDHRAAGWITTDSVVAARDPHFFPELDLTPHRPDALLLWEADQPNHVEGAAGYERAKIDALLCHRSQFESTMGIGGDSLGGPAGPVDDPGFTAKVHRQLAAHGRLAGLGSGEAFHLITDL